MSLQPRTNFGPAPAGYIPGLGRGAVGFTTRSDIGSARAPSADAPPGFEGKKKEEDYSDAQFDKFSGFAHGLFSGGEYDKEDKEADAVYAAIDARMASRRVVRKEKRLREELEEYRKKRPRIQDQFKDLKRGLGDMDSSAWESIPESLDFSRRNKSLNKKKDKYTPVPDSILTAGRGPGQTNTLDNRASQNSGMETPLGFMTPISGPTDLTQLGRARDKVLSLKLDRMADSVGGQTVVDPKGYLTDLNSIKVNSDAEISDIKKARQLLKSVIVTNPKHGPGWIAAARLEYEVGRHSDARSIIMKGCDVCPTCEDVWIEASGMHNPRDGKAILAKAVQHIPTSTKLWLLARDLETDIEAQKAVLRRALEIIPHSVKLWKAAIEMEEPEDARILLSRAVELVPHNVDFWLAYARLETYRNAQKILNQARQAIPKEKSIWITAARLEEASGNIENVDLIIQKAVKSLAAHQVIIDRESWLGDSEICEKSGAVATCHAIVKATVAIGVDDQDRKATWLNDAEHYVTRGSIEVARAIFQHMLSVFPSKQSVWMRAAQLERQYGSSESLDAILNRAVQYCPQAEILWLMAAKEKWMAGDVAAARDILSSAFNANPDSEEVWLAAVKLESENKEYERARILLLNARESSGASTSRVWMKSAKLERQLGNRDEEIRLLDKALEHFPTAPKLWIMKAQFYSSQAGLDNNNSNSNNSNHDDDEKMDVTTPARDEEAERKNRRMARNVYKEAIKKCPHDTNIWLCYTNFELSATQSLSRARSILETARLHNPANPELWLASIRVERQAGKYKFAGNLMAKALQECPTSGLLWAHAIATDPRPLRKSRSYDALQKCTDDPHVFAAVAKLFWLDRKLSKARDWFNRAVTTDPDLGDIWAFLYKFEKEHGGRARAQDVIKRCVEADPKHGELWTKVSKDDRNVGLTTVDILKRVTAGINDIFAANPNDLTGGKKKSK